MAIKNYTTKVDAYTSIGEIQGALAKFGAKKVMIDYDNGKPVSVAFALEGSFVPPASKFPLLLMARSVFSRSRSSRPRLSRQK